MDIHEHQAKAILADFGVPVPKGYLAFSPEQAAHAFRQLGGTCVVKAQIHSGGRGAAGGVKLCKSEAEVRAFAATLLGRTLVTKQTGAGGKLVERLWVEEATDIAQEIYLGFVLDRKSERIMIVASGHGGMEIEDLAENDPDSLVRMVIDPAAGLVDYQARELAFRLGLTGRQVGQFVTTLRACYRAYRDLDAMMVEINPLAITGAGDLVALDAKMSFDTNALYRRPQVEALRDPGQEDPRESSAHDAGLAYVGLEGDIGCIVNGAGLAMATMDTIKLAGGEPANFLDIGGGASPARVVTAFRTVLTDPNVSVILVNIFAGINRCDWIAKGVVQAYEEVGLTLPVVVRLSGTNVEEGREIIRTSGLPLISADTLAEAAPHRRAAPPHPHRRRIRSAHHGHSHHQGHENHRSGHVGPDRSVPCRGNDRIRHECRGRRHAGQGGRNALGPPALQHSAGAVEATGADASLLFVPPAFAADAIMEAADAGSISTAVCVTDGLPAQDMMKVKRFLKRYPRERKMRLIGPNCAGMISPASASWDHAAPYLHGRPRRHRRPVGHTGL